MSKLQALRDGIRWEKVRMKQPSIRPIITPEAEREEHSPTGFSGWDRHSACHGSVAMASLFPRPQSGADADLGNVAHAAGAEWLMRGYCPKGVDKVMEDFLRPYVYSVWDRLVKTKRAGDVTWFVEGRVAAPSIHVDCRGTVDGLIWDAEAEVLMIDDLKYGKRPVSAERNVQLMGYAVCAVEQLGIRPKRVELRIHQVRLSATPSLYVIDDMMELESFEDDVREHYAAIEEQRAVLKRTRDPRKLDLVAGDHCVYCPAKLHCHEREEAAKREGIDLLVRPDPLSADAGRLVAFALRALPWAAAMLKDARAHMMKGGAIPGLKMVAGKRVRVAKDRDMFMDELTLERELGGVGLRPDQVVAPGKPLTIPQLEEVVGKKDKERAKAFAALWEWRQGAPQLALESDDRPAIEGRVRAEDYFEVVEDDDEQP